MRNIAFAVLSLFMTTVAAALTPSNPCSALSSAQDVLTCVQRTHPDIQRAEARVAGLNAYERAAGQRPNPELEADSVFPSDSDAPSAEVEANLRHTFELGGKRGKRIEEARRQHALLTLQADRVREEVTVETVLNLHRLRQLSGELAAVDESLTTFRKVIRQFSGRPRLGSEQDVSLSVFRLAEGDYEIKRARLIQEEMALSSTLQLQTGGRELTIEPRLLPPPPAWPDLSSSSASLTAGAAWKEAEAEEAVAKAALDSARGQAVPDLSAGPRAVLTSGRGQGRSDFGASVDLALPVYQRNKGAIALSENELRRAVLSKDLVAKELAAKRTALAQIYAASVSSLEQAPDLKEIERKHRNAEGLFERGLVSASLVIEAHRQMTEFLADQHEQELEALKALWTIYAIDGRALEERL